MDSQTNRFNLLIVVILTGYCIAPRGTSLAQSTSVVQFDLSDRSTYVLDRVDWRDDLDHLKYFSQSARYTQCNDCPTGSEEGCNDCWWAMCDKRIADSATLAALRTYLTSIDDNSAARFAKDKDGLHALVYYEPEGALQRLLPDSRVAWNEIQPLANRQALIALGRDCNLAGAELVLSLSLQNSASTPALATSVSYVKLEDYGEAGGGAEAGLAIAVADYVHQLEHNCMAETDTQTFALDPPLRIEPAEFTRFELQPIFKSDGGFLAPIRMRIDIKTTAGTISTEEFLVEAPSCAG